MKAKYKTAKYSAVINGWAMYATACGNSVEITPHMPEQLSITFDTTGEMGGNHSHGGEATLSFRESGCTGANDVYSEENEYGDFDHAQITCRGDWELGGLTASLILLGRVLEAQKVGEVTSFSMIDEADNILFEHAAWATPDPVVVDNDFIRIFNGLPGAK